jgi:hypothetical protein
MGDSVMKENLIKNEGSKMPEAIREAINNQYKSIDIVNEYLLEEIEIIEKLQNMPDDNPEKIKKKKEIHDTLVEIGIITENNELTDNYK